MSHPLVVHASSDGYADVREWSRTKVGAEIDSREDVEIQELISTASVGATDLNFGLVRMNPGAYHLKHHHPRGSEYYYFTRGHCIVNLDGIDVPASPGTAIYIPANCVHSVLNHTEEIVEFVCGLSVGEYRELGLVYDE